MSPTLLRREPVVNRHKAITATRLIIHAASAQAAAAELNALADIWPDTRSVLVGLAGAAPDSGLFDWQPPPNAMIEIPANALGDPVMQALIAGYGANGVPLCLDDYVPGTPLPPQPQFRFILADAAQHPQLKDAPGLLIAKRLASHQDFAAAIEHGYSGAAGWFFLHGMPVADKLSASHGQIVRVLNLVRRNADIGEIETALKQDVTLSFKLLRYINSVGFGLAVEIQSFRHAVTILGYSKLNKWLSLLLVTASRDPAAPALMQTAIARGRFMELVAREHIDKRDLDNLFIAGAFSLLDILLGVLMETALADMHLPAAIGKALVDGEGPYAPYLELARAGEQADAAAYGAAAGALRLSADDINRAQLEALGFADSLQT